MSGIADAVAAAVRGWLAGDVPGIVTGSIVWAWPWALLALPLPWLVHRFAPPLEARAERALRVPDPARFDLQRDGDAAGEGGRRPRLLMTLLVLAWCALVLAMARPQGWGEPLRVPSSGRDIMLGIDISQSMNERDLYAGNVQASRMAVVREVARDFVRRRAGDRIGLVMFGSQAYVQTPLTRDHETVMHFLDEATVGLAGRSTAIGDAIGLSIKRLKDRPTDSRVIVLLTDGENRAGVVEPLEAAAVAAREGIRIHTIGVGSSGGRGVLGGRRSEIDEGTLRAIADTTGGLYFRARSRDELAAIYRRIDELEPSEDLVDEYRPVKEMQAWPLSMAVLLSFAWAALRARSLPGAARLPWSRT